MAGTTVTTTIRIVGEDRASKSIKAVREELDATAKATMHAAEKSGDIERGFRGVKDVLGSLGSSELQSITDKFGGIESLIKGFGPALGPVAVGIAAIGAGVGALYQQAESLRKATLEAAATAATEELERAKASKAVLADRYKITAELLGVETEINAVKADQAKAQQQATDLAALEAKQIAAIKEERKYDAAQLAVKIEAGKQQLQVTQEQFALDQQAAKQVDRRAASALYYADNAGSVLERERAIELTVAGTTKIKLQQQLIDDKRKDLAIKIAGQQAIEDDATRRTVAGAKVLADLKAQMFGLAKAEFDLSTQAGDLAAAAHAKAKAAHDAAVARRKKIAEANSAFALAEVADAEAAYQAKKEIGNREVLAAQERAKAEHDAKAALRVSAQALTADPAEKARLQLIEIEIEQTEKLDAARQNLALNDEARAAQLLAIEQEANGKRLAILTSEQQRKDAAAKAEIDNGFAIAKAGLSALEQLGIGRQALDGLRAAESAAEALYQASIGNIPGAIAAGAAAVQFGIAAGTSTPQVGGAGGGGGFAAQTAQIGAAPSGGVGGAVVVNFGKGFVVGTAQDVGKAVSKAVKSIGSTGYPQKQAA